MAIPLKRRGSQTRHSHAPLSLAHTATKQLQERLLYTSSKCNVFESPLWHRDSSSSSSTSVGTEAPAAAPSRPASLPPPSAQATVAATFSSFQVDAQSLPWMCALPRCLAALPRVCALLRSQSDAIWRLMCDLSDVLNATSNNEKKRKLCSVSDQSSARKNGVSGVDRGGNESEEGNGVFGDHGNIVDGVADISETQTLAFGRGRDASCCWGAHAATLIDAATVATGVKEPPSQHQLLTVRATAAESDETDYVGGGGGGADHFASCGGPLVLQRYAVYVSGDNETPIQIAKRLGLPLADILRWNQKRYEGLVARSVLFRETALVVLPDYQPLWALTKAASFILEGTD